MTIIFRDESSRDEVFRYEATEEEWNFLLLLSKYDMISEDWNFWRLSEMEIFE